MLFSYNNVFERPLSISSHVFWGLSNPNSLYRSQVFGEPIWLKIFTDSGSNARYCGGIPGQNCLNIKLTTICMWNPKIYVYIYTLFLQRHYSFFSQPSQLLGLIQYLPAKLSISVIRPNSICAGLTVYSSRMPLCPCCMITFNNGTVGLQEWPSLQLMQFSFSHGLYRLDCLPSSAVQGQRPESPGTWNLMSPVCFKTDLG